MLDLEVGSVSKLNPLKWIWDVGSVSKLNPLNWIWDVGS